MTRENSHAPLAPSPRISCLPQKDILGVPVHAVRFSEVIELCLRAAKERSRLRISVVNAAKIVNMRSDQLLARSVLEADLVLADGMSVVMASRLLRQELPERITGIDLFEHLLAAAEREDLSVFFLGAHSDVLDEVLKRIRIEYPRLRVAGYHDGYFSEAEESEIASEIAESEADFLFIAITSPKKEIFMARWERNLGVPVIHGVGGSFDVYSGRTRRAPESWQRWGLEWLYRLVQEPRRMWKRYLVTNSIFTGMLIASLFRTRRKSCGS